MKDYNKEIEACEFKILQITDSITKSKDKIKELKRKIKKLKEAQQKDERKKIMKLISVNKIKTADEFEKILDAAQSRQEENQESDE